MAVRVVCGSRGSIGVYGLADEDVDKAGFIYPVTFEHAGSGGYSFYTLLLWFCGARVLNDGVYAPSGSFAFKDRPCSDLPPALPRCGPPAACAETTATEEAVAAAGPAMELVRLVPDGRDNEEELVEKQRKQSDRLAQEAAMAEDLLQKMEQIKRATRADAIVTEPCAESSSSALDGMVRSAKYRILKLSIDGVSRKLRVPFWECLQQGS